MKKVSSKNAIKGYKLFYGDNNNSFGVGFKDGEVLNNRSFEDIPKFKYFEKLLGAIKYNNVLGNEFSIVEVEGFGNVSKENGEREYYDYESTYTANNLKINKFLTREDIIEKALELNEVELALFVCMYKLTGEEKAVVLNKYPYYKSIKNNLEYFQDNKKQKAKVKIK